MNREEIIADRVARNAGSSWMREIGYDFAVAIGDIPAYQTYFGTTMFIERGRAYLKNRKRDIVKDRGQAEYDELVRAFDELAGAWETIGRAEESMSKARHNFEELKGKLAPLRSRLLEW